MLRTSSHGYCRTSARARAVKDIANHIGNCHCRQYVDSAIARAHRQIELLQEYRTRLIADVVTGKLDVREAAAQLPGEADDQGQLQEGGPLPDGMYEDLHAPGEFAEELAMPSNMP